MANNVTRREFDDMSDKVDKIHGAVFGNGKPGMDEQIRYIYDWIGRREKREDFLVKTVVGTALAAIVMLLLNAFLFFARIWPILEKLSDAAP